MVETEESRRQTERERVSERVEWREERGQPRWRPWAEAVSEESGGLSAGPRSPLSAATADVGMEGGTARGDESSVAQGERGGGHFQASTALCGAAREANSSKRLRSELCKPQWRQRGDPAGRGLLCSVQLRLGLRRLRSGGSVMDGGGWGAFPTSFPPPRPRPATFTGPPPALLPPSDPPPPLLFHALPATPPPHTAHPPTADPSPLLVHCHSTNVLCLSLSHRWSTCPLPTPLSPTSAESSHRLLLLFPRIWWW